MALRILALVSGALLTACSAFGIRSVEESAYEKLGTSGDVEIRVYAPRIAAETVVHGDQIAARSTGFRRLAGYIFGGNRSHAGTAVTIPVTQASADQAPQNRSAKSVTIAMTVPVDQMQESCGEWRIRFFMPAHYRGDTLPLPLDPAVRIVAVPRQTVAVLRYSGVPSARAVQTANFRLLRSLEATGWRATGVTMAWFYDPPWTVPPLRRNEAAVDIRPSRTGD